jgi:hypothetical protein
MSLDEEIMRARKEIVSDGYDMSLGEVVNLYKDNELKINPEFQRLFRWDSTRKTRFIESLLLGIPIPPIFVFQGADGNWELIDGLQRLSTVLEFWGVLHDANGEPAPPSIMEGTGFLPSLAGATWQMWEQGNSPISKTQQLQIKRARIRVEILLKESDENAKFELFQRLNTGGAALSEQEVRNCVAVMINPKLNELLAELSRDPPFVTTTSQTDVAIEKQVGVELVLRFFSFRKVPYSSGLDVHEYLDKALIDLAKNDAINWVEESSIFRGTFHILNDALGDSAFRRWDGASFRGMFLMSVYEVLAHGVAHNLEAIQALGSDGARDFVIAKAKALWSTEVFQRNSGAGVRGTTRLTNLLPFAKDYLRP